MAQAFSATAVSAVAVAAENAVHRNVMVQNRGPESIWVDLDGAATTTVSVEVGPGLPYSFPLPPGYAVNIRSTSASQVSPADTRIEIAETPG